MVLYDSEENAPSTPNDSSDTNNAAPSNRAPLTAQERRTTTQQIVKVKYSDGQTENIKRRDGVFTCPRCNLLSNKDSGRLLRHGKSCRGPSATVAISSSSTSRPPSELDDIPSLRDTIATVSSSTATLPPNVKFEISEDEICVLAMEKTKAKREKVLITAEELGVLQAKASELEGLKFEIKELRKQKEEYGKWKDSEARRVKLVETLREVKAERKALQLQVQGLRKQKEECEKWKDSEARRLELVETLREVEAEREALQIRVQGLEELLGKFVGEVSEEGASAEDVKGLVRDGTAILPVLGAVVAENGELRNHVVAFRDTNLKVRALLEAADKDTQMAGEYLKEARVVSGELVFRALVLPRPVSSSMEVARFEESLERWKGRGQSSGSKRSREGSGEGSEDRRKRARSMLGSVG